MSAPAISIIAAVAENGAIGARNGLPWRLPTDFAFFKATTMGKPLIMGRKTFESIGRPLPGRTMIVVSRQAGYAPENVLVFTALCEAIAEAQEIAVSDGVDEIFIGGGAEIYRQAMSRADRLYITHVAARPEADAFFPEIDAREWDARVIEAVKAGLNDSAPFTVCLYTRRRDATD